MLLYCGDAKEVLSGLVDESVRCCVTSPPYWGLRNYGNERQIGLESSPEEYVSRLVDVFREIRRVLTKDGTLWLNIGDTWAANRSYQVTPTKWKSLQQGQPSRVPDGLKPKDLVGIPWRTAFALQSDGWFLRQDIIWNKPNAMPESVTDRCTKSHEYLFLLSKSGSYYFDNKAISEPSSNAGKVITLREKSFSKRQADGAGVARTGNATADEYVVKERRNRRSVWTIPTKPYRGAHFAVMPESLVEPCIIAGTEAGDFVLDPFAGSGTVGVVAERLGRSFIGIELNEDYCKLAAARVSSASGTPPA